ncbi:P-loop NTPase fold protein [Sphingobacterium sp. R2]|uniref:P-loop NTPase fold protein n=1 Tax=Sphingobacterium sp. R2 TaxID=3112958 RepID=UPI00345DDCAD
MAETNTTIILNESTNAKKFNDKNIIHLSQFNAVKSLISKFLIEDLDSNHSHNTITLLGSRGSGKTSFLLSLENELKSHEEIEVLNIIDPTLIEEKGHVFLNLISAICDLVNNHFTSCRCNPYKFNKDIENQWKKSVTKLAAGLPSIDHLSRDSEFVWQDPEYVMENELRAVGAARNLRQYFNEFLTKSLDILKKEVFLVLFDDIDVDSSKGYAILETIRKYFITGRIITVLSGDFKLYNSLIRQSKWKNFGQEILRYEASKEYQSNEADGRIRYYDDMVTDLTSQYLLKIMQPQYRFQLDTLYNVLNSTNRLCINIQVSEKEMSMPLEKLLQKIFAQLGVNNGYQLESQKHFLLNQPLRTIVHFLQRIVKSIKDDDVELTYNVNIVSVLLADLYEKNILIETLVNSPKNINIEILKLLIRDKQLKELYQLSPTSSDNSLNAGVFSLNILFSSAVSKYRFLIFDYLIRISFLRNIIDYYPEGYSLERGLIKESGVLNDLVLRDIMNTMQIYHYSSKVKKGNSFSLISLLGLKMVAKKSGLEDRLDAVLNQKEVSSAQRMLGYVPCLAGEHLYTNGSELFYSFYTLLSSIGELLKRFDLFVNDISNLELAFTELSQIRYYSFQEKVSNEMDDSDDSDNSEEFNETEMPDRSEDKDIQEFTKIVNKWMEDFRGNNLSIHLLGKIFTRFYVGISNLMNSHNERKLGRLFHLSIVNFMNAILIEDVRENLSSGDSRVLDLNHSNIVSSEKVFIDNLKKVNGSKNKKPGEKDKLKLSKWLIGCPMIIAYLDESKKDLVNELKKFYDYSLDTKFNVYKLLDNVSLAVKRSSENVNNNKRTDWKSDKSLIKKVNYEKLIGLLENEGVDMKLFKNMDTVTNTANNKIIRNLLPFLQSSEHIRNFRNYLEEKSYFTN